MNNHEEVYNLLAGFADVTLISKLKTDDLGSPIGKIYFFVSDLHMVTKERTEYYKSYSTNNYDLFAQLISKLDVLKKSVKDVDVEVFQLGDFFDLWRQTMDVTAKTAYETFEQIVNDPDPSRPNVELWNKMINSLGVHQIAGNHDYELYQSDEYKAKYEIHERLFLKSKESGKNNIMMLHGDVFDWLENLFRDSPFKFLQEIAVYLAKPTPEKHKTLREKVENERLRKLKNLPSDDSSKAYKIKLSFLKSAKSIADSGDFNVNVEHHKFLDSACDLAQEINNQSGSELNVIFIGHTHYPRINTKIIDNQKFILVDVGAWLEKLEYDNGTVVDSSQLTVLCDNEVRIYQLAPKKQT